MAINLSLLAQTGYYFCHACQKVTHRVQRGVKFVCVRCGASEKYIEWMKGLDE